MKTEDNKRIESLAYIIADLKEENIEMTQRVHQLTDDYNEAVRQQHEVEARKDENSYNQMPEEMQQMFDRCSELELENEKLKRIAKEFHYFVEDKKLYMKNKSSCGYEQDRPVVCFKSCQECSSFLGVIEGIGVIFKKRLADASVVFPNNDWHHTHNSSRHDADTTIRPYVRECAPCVFCKMLMSRQVA